MQEIKIKHPLGTLLLNEEEVTKMWEHLEFMKEVALLILDKEAYNKSWDSYLKEEDEAMQRLKKLYADEWGYNINFIEQFSALHEKCEFDFITALNEKFGKWHSTNADWGGYKVWKVANTTDDFVGRFLFFDDDAQTLVCQSRERGGEGEEDIIHTIFEVEKKNIETFLKIAIFNQ